MEQDSIDTTELWFNQYGESVYRRCRRILRNDAAAWDATQDVFIRAHKGAARFRGDSSVLTWLLTIADRRCFDVLKKQRKDVDKTESFGREHAPPSLDEDHAIESHLIQSNLVGHLLRGCTKDAQELQIVVLRFFDELDHEAIARRLGISRKTVHRKLEKFFARSRQILSHAEPHERRL